MAGRNAGLPKQRDALAIAGQAMIGRFLGASDAEQARAAARRMLEWGVVADRGVAKSDRPGPDEVELTGGEGQGVDPVQLPLKQDP